MKNLRNKVQLIGRLGMDPEVIDFDSGKKKVKFTLATTDYHKDAEGNKTQTTEWHNLVVWGKTAGIAQEFLKKGSEIAVEGKLTHRSYEDKNGVKRYITEVIVDELVMMSKKAS